MEIQDCKLTFTLHVSRNFLCQFGSRAVIVSKDLAVNHIGVQASINYHNRNTGINGCFGNRNQYIHIAGRYSIAQVMEKYLSHVYAPTDRENRYDYIPGECSSGVVVYDDKFVYSHHATAPAGGKLLNAFDLVRTHLFDNGDEKKSFNEMAEFAAGDERVHAQGLAERMERAGEEFAEDADWMSKLVRQKRNTKVENSLFNIKLILQNDPYLKHIVFNQLVDAIEIKGEVPWQHPSRF